MDYYRILSRILSQVMEDIGVNEEVVMNRRRSYLIRENLDTLAYRLLQSNDTYYIFGSQTEGTTTDGLKSDVDTLVYNERFNLIQDLNDWVPRKTNLLMVPNDRFPGYCKLHLLKEDGPYPEEALPSDRYTFDKAGRVILLNHFNKEAKGRLGPAERVYHAEGAVPNDFVRAIHCKTWPTGYKMWSTHLRKGTWPTLEMISYMKNSGYFVVQVAHCLDERKSESWKISTSLAERCLMFSLNITQIRCYTLIKMIARTFIDPVIKGDIISSYVCKNLLFHCVENTKPDFWQESNLLRCVNQILLNMLEAIRCMNCPNYFNESINLFLGKVNKDNQVVLMGVILKVLDSEGLFALCIGFDKINELILNYDETIYQGKDCSRVEKREHNHHTLHNGIGLFVHLGKSIQKLMLRGKSRKRDLMSLQNTILLFAVQGPLQYVSATFLFPFLCSHLATLKASEHILHGEMFSRRTSWLYERSLDSDVTSSRLKFASYLYCTGQFERAMLALAEVDRRFDDGCISICGCDVRKTVNYDPIDMDPSEPIKDLSPSHVSMCVMFSQAERRCCPRELQYEMHKSTEQEKLQRNKMGHDDWMDLACIDSLSYLYFLRYMTSRHLGLRELQLLALKQLQIRASVNGNHRETVHNLLGQCYKYENRFDDAFECYCQSLRVRPTNNAARLLIALLLFKNYQNE